MIRRAIVIGCGIAGPAIAILLRALGIEATIAEARPAEALDGGAFLGVAPNGVNVLAEAGIAASVLEPGFGCDGFVFRNGAGRVIGTIDRRSDLHRFGAALTMIRRADLQRGLRAQAERRGARLEFGRGLARIEQPGSDGVAAVLDDGTVLEGDVLLGCDGVRSRTRRLALPGAPVPGYTGLLDFAGFAPDPGRLAPRINEMVFGRRAFFGAFATGRGEVWWFHNRAGEASSSSSETARTEILELHRDDPEWIGELVRSTDRVLGPWPLHDILRLPRWHDRRVCLLGDAAHATSPSAGQGASLALEDALVLATCLRRHPEPSRAFTAFAELRRARVESIVRQARRNGSGKAVSGPVAAWFRDRMLPMFLRLGQRTQDQAYAFRARFEDDANRSSVGSPP